VSRVEIGRRIARMSRMRVCGILIIRAIGAIRDRDVLDFWNVARSRFFIPKVAASRRQMCAFSEENACGWPNRLGLLEFHGARFRVSDVRCQGKMLDGVGFWGGTSNCSKFSPGVLDSEGGPPGFLSVLRKLARCALLRKILHRDSAQYVKIEARCLWVGAQRERARTASGRRRGRSFACTG
jgi:hypothetical protein